MFLPGFAESKQPFSAFPSASFRVQVFMLLPNILNEKGLFGCLALLQVDSLATLTSELSRLLDQADKQIHMSTADTQALSQLALDRLAQALQVAMANGALLCSRGEQRNGSKDKGSNQYTRSHDPFMEIFTWFHTTFTVFSAAAKMFAS